MFEALAVQNFGFQVFMLLFFGFGCVFQFLFGLRFQNGIIRYQWHSDTSEHPSTILRGEAALSPPCNFQTGCWEVSAGSKTKGVETCVSNIVFEALGQHLGPKQT